MNDKEVGETFFCRFPNHETFKINGKKYKLHELLEEIRIHYSSRSKKSALIELILEKSRNLV